MLYTKKGDQGTTKLFDTPSGERISKSDIIFEALGSIDELNSFLGLCKIKAKEIFTEESISGFKIEEIVHKIQEDLFVIQAILAGSDMKIELEKVLWLEDITNKIETKLPPINTFFISGGTELAVFFDFSRTLARRAERRIVECCESKGKDFDEHLVAYINRLSSVLYACARLSNHFSGIKEVAPKYEQ